MAIELDIQKNFKGFSLDVRLKGQDGPIGILGASGSGKSMTLRSIAGIETPDSGRIIINGKTVFDSEAKINLKPQERRVGYLFQNYALFPTMTVEKNIACGYRGEKSELSQKVADYIKRYHLEGLEKHLPSQLSGGQQQRVALARMMIGEPEVILLDEPFSALDGYLKDILQRDMQNFLKDYKGDMIMVTHSRDEAYKFLSLIHILQIMAGNCAHNYNNIDFNVLRRKPDRHVSERRRKCSSTGGYEQIWNAVSVDHVYWIAAIYDQSGILQYPSRMRRDCSAYEGGSYCSTCESCIQLSSYLW